MKDNRSLGEFRKRSRVFHAEVAFTILDHPILEQPKPARAHPRVISLLLMKKSSRREHPSEPSPRNKRRQQGAEGRWEFSGTGSLVTLGAPERGTAYYTSGGELRFLPR